MNSAQRLILVTGTPGTGKTDFATRLSKELGAQYVSLNRSRKGTNLYTKIDRRRNSKIVSFAKCRAYLRSVVSSAEGLVVVDSHIPGIAPRELTKQVFVLRCNPKTLTTRLRKRGWRDEKIRENVLAEIVDSCLIEAVEEYGAIKVRQLITSRSDLQYCVRSAKMILSGKTVENVNVDWLYKLQRYPSFYDYLR